MKLKIAYQAERKRYNFTAQNSCSSIRFFIKIPQVINDQITFIQLMFLLTYQSIDNTNTKI